MTHLVSKGDEDSPRTDVWEKRGWEGTKGLFLIPIIIRTGEGLHVPFVCPGPMKEPLTFF